MRYHNGGDGAHWFSVMKAGLNLIGPEVGDPSPSVLTLPIEFHETRATLLRGLGYTVQTNR
jgi:hypothetical protein